MKNIFQIFSLIFIVSLTSCDEDFFQSTVAIELPEHVAQLTVSGTMTHGAEEVGFYISSSKSLNDSGNLEEYPDAKVSLFKDNILLASPIFNPATLLHEATVDSTAFESGSTYRLEVEQEGFETITSEQKMPKQVVIEGFKFEEQGTFDDFGEPADAVTIEFTDDPNEENYYLIEGISSFSYFNGVDTIRDRYPTELGSIDPNVVRGYIAEYQSAPMISDATFNGKKYQMNMYSYSSFFGGGDDENFITVYLRSITRERYLYLLSLDRFYQSQGDLFAEPVTVAGNIQNGLGSFGAQTLDSLIIR